MRAIKASIIPVLVLALSAFVAENVTSAEKCCECGCEYKLKKVYKPIVSFKEVKFTCYDYTTRCEDVPAATSTCCKTCCGCGCGCDGCDVKCSCPGKPTTISVPVAHPCKCKECVRKVPCVTWVVECKCEKCCKKCKHKHECKACSH